MPYEKGFTMKKRLISALFPLVVVGAYAGVAPKNITLGNDIFNVPAVQQFIKANPKLEKAYKLGVNSGSKTLYQDLTPLINGILTGYEGLNYNWNCDVLNTSDLNKPGTVKHYTLSCSGSWPSQLSSLTSGKNITNLKVNVVTAGYDPQKSTVGFTPLVAADSPSENCNSGSYCQETLLTQVNDYNNKSAAATKVLAAINGSYFYINNASRGVKAPFWDSNCLRKPFDVLFGNPKPIINTAFIGDGLTIIDGQTYSNNCATFDNPLLKWADNGSPDRATFLMGSSGPVIQDVASGANPSVDGVKYAIGSGPMLMQNGNYDNDWQAIPSTFEYSANTSVAVATRPSEMNNHKYTVFFTVDGNDKSNGMFSFEMANLFKYILTSKLGSSRFEVQSMMSMDQGGSTTMVTCQDGENCQKSSSANGSGGSSRAIFNGLAITQ